MNSPSRPPVYETPSEPSTLLTSVGAATSAMKLFWKSLNMFWRLIFVAFAIVAVTSSATMFGLSFTNSCSALGWPFCRQASAFLPIALVGIFANFLFFVMLPSVRQKVSVIKGLPSEALWSAVVACALVGSISALFIGAAYGNALVKVEDLDHLCLAAPFYMSAFDRIFAILLFSFVGLFIFGILSELLLLLFVAGLTFLPAGDEREEFGKVMRDDFSGDADIELSQFDEETPSRSPSAHVAQITSGGLFTRSSCLYPLCCVAIVGFFGSMCFVLITILYLLATFLPRLRCLFME